MPDWKNDSLAAQLAIAEAAVVSLRHIQDLRAINPRITFFCRLEESGTPLALRLRSEVIGALASFGKAACPYVLKAYQQRRLTSMWAVEILNAIGPPAIGGLVDLLDVLVSNGDAEYEERESPIAVYKYIIECIGCVLSSSPMEVEKDEIEKVTRLPDQVRVSLWDVVSVHNDSWNPESRESVRRTFEKSVDCSGVKRLARRALGRLT